MAYQKGQMMDVLNKNEYLEGQQRRSDLRFRRCVERNDL